MTIVSHAKRIFSLLTVTLLFAVGCGNLTSTSEQKGENISDPEEDSNLDSDAIHAPAVVTDPKSQTFVHKLSVPEGTLLTHTLPDANYLKPLTMGIDAIKIDKKSKTISWATDEMSGPSSVTYDIRTSDHTIDRFVIEVLEVNSAPVMKTKVFFGKLGVGKELNIQVEASDPDFPANKLSYALIDAPDGLSVNEFGLITGMVDGKIDDVFDFKVQVSDDGKPSLSVEAEVYLRIGRSAPKVLQTLHPPPPLPKGETTFALLVEDTDKHDSVTLKDHPSFTVVSTLSGPRKGDNTGEFWDIDLTPDQWLFVLKSNLTSSDNERLFELSDKYGFEVEHEVIFDVNAEPKVENLRSAWVNDTYPHYAEIKFDVIDTQSPTVSVGLLNGEPIPPNLTPYIYIFAKDDGILEVLIQLYSINLDECMGFNGLAESNVLSLVVDDGLNPVSVAANFEVPPMLHPAPNIDIPEFVWYDVDRPTAYFALPFSLTCQMEVSIVSTSPSVGEFSIDNGAVYWTPGEDVRTTSAVNITLDVRDKVVGNTVTTQLNYILNTHPVWSGSVAPITTSQGSSIAFELPFVDPNVDDPEAGGFYDLQTAFKKSDQEVFRFPSAGNRPLLEFDAESKKFFIDWEISCPDFSPGTYELFFRIRQWQNGTAPGGAHDMGFAEYLRTTPTYRQNERIGVVNLVVHENQPCSTQIESLSYDIIFNPPIDSILDIRYSDGSLFATTEFSTDRDLYHFQQDITLTVGRRLTWSLSKNGNLLKSFETDHFGPVTMDHVDLVIVNIPNFTADLVSTYGIQVDKYYKETCRNWNGWLRVPCTYSLHRLGLHTVTLQRHYRQGNGVSSDYSTCNTKNIEVTELPGQPIDIDVTTGWYRCD